MIVDADQVVIKPKVVKIREVSEDSEKKEYLEGSFEIDYECTSAFRTTIQGIAFLGFMKKRQ